METIVKKQPVEPVVPVIADDVLPDDWELKTIGEICQKVDKVDPKAAPQSEIQYIDIGGIDNQLLRIVDTKTYLGKDAPSRARQLVKTNDVVISTVRTYLKNIALVPDELDGQVASTGFCVLRTGDAWMGKYLYYFVQSEAVLKEIGKQQRGTSYPAVRDSDIKAQFVPVPPKKDVRRIVEAIELQLGRLDAAVARLHAAKAKLKRYKQSVMKAAVEGTYSDTPLERWTVNVLGDVATTIRNGYSKQPDAEDGIRIFRISAVRPLELFVDDVRYLDPKTTDHEKSLVTPGDVLFTRYNGSRDMVGACALVPDDCPPTVHPDKLIRVRVPEKELLPGMLAILGTIGEGRDYIESKIRTTAGQSGISGGDLKSLPLCYPPVKEQKRIIHEVEIRLNGMQEMETTLDAQLAHSTRLRQSVLKRAFEGRLV